MRGDAIDNLLRVVGMAVWLVVGSPSWTRLAREPATASSAPGLAWVALYLLFAAAFVAATSPRVPLALRRLLLAAEALLALGLACLGMPHFEGALFALVAAQAPLLLAPPAALAGTVVQGAVLLAIVLPSHGLLGAAKAVGEYLAFSLFALLVIVLRERERSARQALAHANATLLATQALLAEQTRRSERLRIAREVHDAIGHGLTAASLHLQLAARVGDPREPVAAAQEAVKATLNEVRDLVRVMRNRGAVEIVPAIRSLCEGIREPRIHLDTASNFRALDSERAHVLFRCVQEALTNAIRHARANNVWVTLSETELTVRDDGIGAARPHLGSGLQGLHERVEEAGGTLRVETERGRGLALRVTFPRVCT
jgi:signal transduction histidine kinase